MIFFYFARQQPFTTYAWAHLDSQIVAISYGKLFGVLNGMAKRANSKI